MEHLIAQHQDFKAECKKAKVIDVDAFKSLSRAVEMLIATGQSIAGNPQMLHFIFKVIQSGQSVVQLFKASKYFSKFLKGLTKKSVKQKIKPDIEWLELKKQLVQVHLKELGERIIAQIHHLDHILNTIDNTEKQLKITQFICLFDDNVNKISTELGQCQTCLTSMEAKINENSKGKKRPGLTAGNVATGVSLIGPAVTAARSLPAVGATVAAVLMTNPVTIAIGAVGLAGIGVTVGVFAGVKLARRKSQHNIMKTLANVNGHLNAYHRSIQ